MTTNLANAGQSILVKSRAAFPSLFRFAYNSYRFVTKPYYRMGKNHYCPVCNHYAKLFYKSPIYQNEFRCPNCDSVERHRLLCLILKKDKDIFLSGKKRVLHIAPEKCLKEVLLKETNIKYISADFDKSRAMLGMDLQNIPFINDTFDIIICNHVLEHIPDDHKAMIELHRVLAPGGWLFLTVPINHQKEKTFEDHSIVTPEQRLRLYGQEDHLRLYGLDFEDRLKEAGFTVEVERTIDSLDAELKTFYCVNKKEYIYICSKGTHASNRRLPFSEYIER